MLTETLGTDEIIQEKEWVMIDPWLEVDEKWQFLFFGLDKDKKIVFHSLDLAERVQELVVAIQHAMPDWERVSLYIGTSLESARKIPPILIRKEVDFPQLLWSLSARIWITMWALKWAKWGGH